jgi:nicotinamidase-related amidase
MNEKESSPVFNFTLQSRRIAYRDGLRCWEIREEGIQCPASETAFIIVDMWDRHWSDGASRRCASLAEKINETALRARAKGSLIVHAPSDTMDFYRGTEGRERFLESKTVAPVCEPVPVKDYPLPIDDSDGGSDSVDQYPPDTRVWKRQTEKIAIDHSRDLICGDEGEQLHSFLASRGIKLLIYMGVHTNMCILNRSFGIKNMLGKGWKTLLVRDLTDAMYNPERAPYVSHGEGTALVVSYIEKFYCPTINSVQIIGETCPGQTCPG